MSVKDLGLVTAYGYAVEGGYTGTEEEFKALLGNVASDLAEIESISASATTLPAGSSATASYNSGAISLGIPSGYTGNGIASVTLLSTSGAEKTYRIAFTDGTHFDFVVTDGEVTDDSLAETLEDYARIDGYYQDMSVGSAEQLISTVSIEDSVPYKFRTSGGSVDIGDREYINGIVGGTVAWNQLVQTSSSSVIVQSGHKYFANINGARSIGSSNGTAIAINDGTKDNITDLTQMFGSTIADYIYSLETANAGAGVSYFRSLFPKPYYAYNAGELLSVSGLQSHDMRGFNAWDEEWATDLTINGIGGNIGSKNHIPVVRGASYYVYSGAYKPYASGVRIEYFDANKNSIGGAVRYSGPYTFPDDCCYIKFGIQQSIYGTTYKNDICINLSWDGERDGEYEPYTINSYALDDSLTLRGIPKLDASNNLYYDGDTYASDGTVTRKYGYVALDGSTDEEWFLQSINSHNIANFFYRLPNAIQGVQNHCMLNRFEPTTVLIADATSEGYSLNASGVLYIRVQSSTASTVDAFKTWLTTHNIEAIYELATPTTESAEPYTNPQIVDDFGTEEYVTDSIVPVGHVTQYMNNLRAKLEMAPESPSEDGDYIVRQASGENSYVALASTTTIQGIIARLEALEGGNE